MSTPAARASLGAREPGVDHDLLIGQDAIFLFGARGVVALVGYDGANVAPLGDADQNLLRRQRALRDAAQSFKTNETARFDFANDEAELIHMREEHHRRPIRCSGRCRDQVAEPVGLRRESERLHLRRKTPPDAALVAAQARNCHERNGERPETFAQWRAADTGVSLLRWNRKAAHRRGPRWTSRRLHLPKTRCRWLSRQRS